MTQSAPKSGSEAGAVWVDRALFAVVLLAAGMAISHHNTDPDLWGHVRYGMDVLSEGLPSVNTYSYNAADYPWINHENLAELIMAVGLMKIGAPVMLALKCAMGVLVFALMYQQAIRRNVAQIAAATAVLLAAVNLMHFWVMRPQLYSYFFFACLIGLLGWVFEGWEGCSALPNRRAGRWAPAEVAWRSERSRWLWMIPVVMLLWTNTHGAFAAGFCILAAYLMGRAAEAVVMRRADAAAIVARHLTVIGLAALATFANPYGWRLHHWMLQSLGSPRPEITEWLSPEFNYVWLPFWTLVAIGAVTWAFTPRRRDLTQTIILALVLSQAFAHRRHIAFLAILCGYWLPAPLHALLSRFQRQPDTSTFGEDLQPAQQKRYAMLLGACAVMLGACLFGQLTVITVKRDQYPVTAFQYIADQNLRGKMVTRFMWAQYAVFAFGSDSPENGIQIAFDGRFRTCYPQEVVDMYFDFVLGADGKWPRWRSDQSPPPNPERILNHNQPDLALLDRKQDHAVATIEQQGGEWTLLYQDELSQLWGRTSIFGDPQSARYIPPTKRRIDEAPQIGAVPWPALPQGNGSSGLLAVRGERRTPADVRNARDIGNQPRNQPRRRGPSNSDS